MYLVWFDILFVSEMLFSSNFQFVNFAYNMKFQILCDQLWSQ